MGEAEDDTSQQQVKDHDVEKKQPAVSRLCRQEMENIRWRNQD